MSVSPQLEESWCEALEEEFQKPYMTALKAFVAQERAGPAAIFPPAEEVFSAFSLTPIDQVKVVIMGQDPYHGPGQAHGLCFSVRKGVPIPPSLQNIYKELQSDLGIQIPDHGCLTDWAKQGVLLLNATLTVSQSSPMSHHGKGLGRVQMPSSACFANVPNPSLFCYRGKSSQQKCRQLTSSQNRLVLKAAHPSPFSAYNGFFSRPFSQTNRFLVEHGKQPIQWELT